MSKEATAALTRRLHELRLATVRSQHEAVARQATAESWSYAAFLLELLERECQQRQHNRIERLLKSSRLPLEKNWSALDLKRLPSKAVQQLRGLLSGEFLDRRENVLAFGPPGAGKTHGLCAVSQELVRAGRTVLYTKCGLLVQELLRAKRDLRLKEKLRELPRLPTWMP
jgi:DNA replication protein DnaC